MLPLILVIAVVVIGVGIYAWRSFRRPADDGVQDVVPAKSESETLADDIDQLAVRITPETADPVEVSVNASLLGELKTANNMGHLSQDVADLPDQRANDLLAGYKVAMNPQPMPEIVDEPMVHVEEDAQIIERIEAAPERRVHYIETNASPETIEELISKITPENLPTPTEEPVVISVPLKKKATPKTAAKKAAPKKKPAPKAKKKK